MNYTHVQGQKPKVANKRGGKDRDMLGDGLCPCAIHFPLLMAAESHSDQRYAKRMTNAKCMTNAKGTI